MDQFRLVACRHHDEIGQGRKVSDVEAASMGRPIGADQSCAVNRKAHRQVLDRHIMHDLVVSALQKC